MTMSRVTEAPPLQLLVGPPDHGVVGYAADVAAALSELDERTTTVAVRAIDDALAAVAHAPRTHLHVTDRLFGVSPEEAADNLERIAVRTGLTLTVHDLPQTSDGTMFPRRSAAYARFFAAARAVTVNSEHEQRLTAEFLPQVGVPHVIPLGARVDRVRVGGRDLEPGGTDARDLCVLIAGYIYPGKGHANAIRAVADAAAILSARGERVGELVVRAIGGPSAGHGGDLALLRAEAERRRVRFDVTGVLQEQGFVRQLVQNGIPLAAHEHVSASRSMLDWVEVGRRPLVVSSRYAQEMAALRPGTLALYVPEDLPRRVAEAWLRPELTFLAPGTHLSPSLVDAAERYQLWWAGLVHR